jgi:hypothetical protein
MVSFSLRQRIFYFLLQDPTPVSFHLSQFVMDSAVKKYHITLPDRQLTCGFY